MTKTITPQVNAAAEFLEILNDFGNPLELLREAISNAIDASALEMWIGFTVEDIGGSKRLVIELNDNGTGMNHEVLERDFLGVGIFALPRARRCNWRKGTWDKNIPAV